MRIAASLIAAGFIGGCGFSGSTSHSWSELVEVTRSQTITIDRRVEMSTSEIRARSWVSFRDGLAGLAPWNEPLVPLLLYQDPSTREWTIVATTSSCDVWSDRGKPAQPYWEYRLSAAGWQLAELSDSSIGRDSNLYLDGFGEMPKAPITVAAKLESRNRAGIPAFYKTIDRGSRGNCS